MIEVSQLNEIAQILETSGVNETTVSILRPQFQPLHFTYCMDDDLPNNNPVLEHPEFNLYLIDGRDHCLCLTNDFSVATGVVIAEVYPE